MFLVEELRKFVRKKELKVGLEVREKWAGAGGGG
jgi:hypothetical protein